MCEERRDGVSERGRRSLGCRMAEVGSEGGGGLCARIVMPPPAVVIASAIVIPFAGLPVSSKSITPPPVEVIPDERVVV